MTGKVRIVVVVLGVLLVAAYIGYRAWYTPSSGDSPTLKALAPSFELKDQDGAQHTLSLVLEKGPALLVFYRGFW